MYEEYNTICVANMQVDIEKLMRENHDLVVQLERAKECENEARLENEIVRKLLKGRREAKDRALHKQGTDIGNHNARRPSTLEESMSLKSLGENTVQSMAKSCYTM